MHSNCSYKLHLTTRGQSRAGAMPDDGLWWPFACPFAAVVQATFLPLPRKQPLNCEDGLVLGGVQPGLGPGHLCKQAFLEPAAKQLNGIQEVRWKSYSQPVVYDHLNELLILLILLLI